MSNNEENLKVALAMSQAVSHRIFPARVLDSLESGATLLNREPMTEFSSERSLALLAEAQALVTGWGCAMINDEVLHAAPNLRYILHAGGTVKNHVDKVCWERGVEISTAADANAIPVAEYTVAMVILANKRVLQVGRKVHTLRTIVHAEEEYPDLGNYNKRVGVIGASKIGRHVIRMLGQYELEVVVADPFLSDAEATALGAAKVTLAELAATSDVVSLHAPSLPSTLNMIHAELIASFKPGATFINTARGELVDQAALLERIQQDDLFAVLDVTTPWDLPSDSGLFTHPNVLVTPHMAGSLGTELERLAMSTVGEAHRLARGEALKFRLPPEQLDLTA